MFSQADFMQSNPSWLSTDALEVQGPFLAAGDHEITVFVTGLSEVRRGVTRNLGSVGTYNILL